MFRRRRHKRSFESIQEVYDKVRRRLAELRGEKSRNLPSKELKEQIARELEEFRNKKKSGIFLKKKFLRPSPSLDEVTLKKNIKEIILEKKQKQKQKKSTKSTVYGDYTPPPIYVKHRQRKKDQPKTGRLSRYRVLPPGSKPIDYVINFPTVLKRFFIDLREPIPVLDKLLFFVVFLIAYFITVISIVGHYKLIKPDINYVIQIENQYVELIVKKEDIQALRNTLGEDWLLKLGKYKLKDSKEK